MNPIRVLIVDDHPLFRQGVRLLLEKADDILVVAEAGDGAAAVSQTLRHHPDVVLLDLSLPDQNGLDVARRLLDSAPGLRIVVLTMHEREGYVLQALDAGVQGYVLKGSPSESILAAIRRVYRDEHYLCPLLKTDILKTFVRDRQNGRVEHGYDALTDREQQVFRLLAEGLATTRIAERLFLSPKTVEKHRVNILRKLKLDSIVELVKYAISIGVVEIDYPPERRR